MVRRLALLLAVVPLLAAKPAPPTPSAPPDAGAILETLKFDSALTLLDPGGMPRQVVKYHPQPGAVASYETVAQVQMDLKMSTPDGEMPIPMGGPMPAMVMSARNTVGQPVKNGLVPVRIEQLGARIEGPASPEVAQAMTDGMARLNGMRFDLLVDPTSGRPVQLDILGGTDPQTAEMMQQLADQIIDRVAVFPTEPIGPGAKWKVDLDLSLSGLELVVTQTITAKTITADAVDLDQTLEMRLGEGGFTMPGMPASAAPDITRFAGTGSGSSRVDLRNLVATGKQAMDVDLAMAMSIPGQAPMSMSMKMGQTTEMRLVK